MVDMKRLGATVRHLNYFFCHRLWHCSPACCFVPRSLWQSSRMGFWGVLPTSGLLPKNPESWQESSAPENKQTNKTHNPDWPQLKHTHSDLILLWSNYKPLLASLIPCLCTTHGRISMYLTHTPLQSAHHLHTIQTWKYLFFNMHFFGYPYDRENHT